jgi:hypothetical protein
VPCSKQQEALVPCSKQQEALVPCSKQQEALAPCSKQQEALVPCSKQQEALLPCSKQQEALVPCSKQQKALVPCSKQHWHLALFLSMCMVLAELCMLPIVETFSKKDSMCIYEDDNTYKEFTYNDFTCETLLINDFTYKLL